ILTADVIIVGSPVYMAYVTGQTKLFLDRLYAFTGPDQISRVPQGKRCVLVLTQGHSDITAYQNLTKSLSSLLTRLGFNVVDTVVLGGVHDISDPSAAEAAAAAFKLGQALTNTEA
ncbi:MAG: NAD(P)H-dependent oxidoreductase, partial [Peptococcaceae bacterium]|nr:NAD(P)H-dependent oxidoreductase [Peptococcaceae bacterium]